jgi:hypothetical protein
MSVYLVNAEGELADVLGYMDTVAKLTALAGESGGVK